MVPRRPPGGRDDPDAYRERDAGRGLGLWWTQSTRYGEIHLGLARLAGCLIAAIGLWRLGRHIGGHGEHDDPGLDVDAGREVPPSLRGLFGLGVAGGMVPCWDAVVLIVLAEATGRLALGIVLLIAFGLGMAGVLVAVGLLAGRFRRLVGRRPLGASPGDRQQLDAVGDWDLPARILVIR